MIIFLRRLSLAAARRSLEGINMYIRHLKSIFYTSKTTVILSVLLFLFNAGYIFKGVSGNWFVAFSQLMEFDRSLILNGEIWRILTCHLVHWSPAHFYLDALVFSILGITFEKTIGQRYWKFLLISAIVISLALLSRQDLHRYRGISGLINTQLMLVMGTLIMTKDQKRYLKGFYWTAFAVYGYKISYETIYRSSLFNTANLGDMGNFTAIAHLSGALMGLGCVLLRPGKRAALSSFEAC